MIETDMAEITDFGWMAGTWKGSEGSKTYEEHWTTPLGGSLVGMFRQVKDGNLAFSEHMSIEKEGEELVMKIRHFGPGMDAWEENEAPMTADLKSFEGTKAVWDIRGEEKLLVYVRHSDQLEVRVDDLDGGKFLQFLFEKS